MSDEHIFALDIGTRSVVGVVMKMTDDGLKVIAYEHMEHQTRAMVDGQIHDVEMVAKVLGTVKDKLESVTGLTLNQAAVAAAGRALKTVRTKVTCDISDYTEITKEDILRLELQAVQQAQSRLDDGNDADAEANLNYHCVGFSVVYYELDGYKIASLFGQRGKNIAVEVIATFLPRVVVDAMFSALNKIGVEMSSLTLEPIAASTVVVPPSMRQLNIALVDVGAGTSDIAITSGGSVIGYGMVPMAGDEITEIISSHFLVDFNQAELIKRAAGNQEEIEFVDVLGNHHCVTKQEVIEVVSDGVHQLAQKISEKIMELNGKTPQAVICIGGGSMTPLLSQSISEHLGLSQQRVAVRGREAISVVTGAEDFAGPEAVTPIGIAVTAYEQRGLGFARIIFNGRQIRLFEINKCTVADVLMAAGVDLRSTRPSLGMALTLMVNDELKIIKGGRGKAAFIQLNGESASLDAPVQNDDIIEFVPAEKGSDAKGFIYDVVPPLDSIEIIVNGEGYLINPVITMNDEVVSYDDELVDSARIYYRIPTKVKEIIESINQWEEDKEYLIYLNGVRADLMSEVTQGDELYFEVLQGQGIIDTGTGTEAEAKFETKSESISESKFESESEVKSNSDIISGSKSDGKFSIGNLFSGSGAMLPIQVEVNDELIELSGGSPILTDLFNIIDVSMRPPKSGMRFEMKINDQKAEFTSPLKNGDRIVLKWVED